MKFKAYLIKSADEARDVIKREKGVPVGIECEWGERTLEEAFLEINHHGDRQGNIPPSAIFMQNNIKIEEPIFFFSHLDLDSIMGAMWLMGLLDKTNEIHVGVALLAAYVDTLGPHYVKENWDSEVYKKWVTIGLVTNRRCKGLLGDITKELQQIIETILDILECKDIDNHPLFLEAYEWKTKIAKTAAEKIRYNSAYMLGFVSDRFMLANYFLLSRVRPIIVQYNPYSKKVSISVINKEIAQKVFGEKGVEGILKEFFGDKAGGRITIGGSPRFEQIEFDKFKKFVKKVDSLSKKKLTYDDVENLEIFGNLGYNNKAK